MTDRELLALLRALSRIGGPLANALNPQLGQGVGGLGSLIGLVSAAQSGNIPGAVGSAAGLGSQVANLAGMPTLAQGLGSVGGPLGLINSILQGNVGGAITSLPATAAAAANAGSAAGLVAPAVAQSVGSIAAALGPHLLMMMPAFVDTGGADIFDSLLGGVKSQAQKQHEEYQDYASRFPGLVQDRVKGASLLDSLNTMTPDQIGDALATATRGIRATDLAPARDVLAQPAHPGKSPMAANIPGTDMSWWDKIAPALEGANWAAFTGLMDKAHNAGIDVNTIAGDRAAQTDPGRSDRYSQSAYDLSNAIAGIGGQLGINWAARGDERAGENQGYTVYDDQLSGYGFTPGNHGAALLKYLSTLDPSVTQHANWNVFKDKLGVTDDMLNAIPAYTIQTQDRLKTPEMFQYQMNAPDGGG